MPTEYYVAWWNLENLFDEENAPPERRTEKVLRTIKNDIVGWTPQLRDRKVAQLASVIAQMNGAAGPDFSASVRLRTDSWSSCWLGRSRGCCRAAPMRWHTGHR